MFAKKLLTRLELNTHQLLAVLAALLFMATSAYVVIELVGYHYRAYLRSELQTVLQSATESVRVWSREQRLLVQSIAQDRHVLEATRKLLAVPQEKRRLLTSSGQREMRYEMRSYLESGFYEGYFIIAPDNISLASSRDTNVGTPNLLINYPELLHKIWNGETRLTPIQHSDVPLQRELLHTSSGNETMFVVTPIKDEKDKIIALMALRINPYITLFPIMEQARIGETGDSFAFDHYGTLLSKSRYDEQLVRMGLLQPGQSSASNLLLLDPGFDLTKNNGTRPDPKELQLTRMAASAVRGEEGINLEGYRDFRGVEVVGTWKWDSDLGFGFAIEQESSEAYAVFHFMRLTTIAGAAITSLVLIVLVVVFSSGKRQIAAAQKRLQAIVETASDGIVVIDEQGRIERINPALETMFGYSAEQLIGNNVSMLMPEPHRSFHDSYLARYFETGENTVIGTEREVDGQRSNGEVFPIDLSVNLLELDNEHYFAGVIRDISERKQTEQALQREKEATENANAMLRMTQEALDRTGIGEYWIAAGDGRILRVNDQACRHLGYTKEELLKLKVPDFDPNFTEELYPSLVAPILEKGWGRIETIHRTKKGVDIPVEIIIVYLPDPPSGEPMSIAFSIDISERKKAEQALIKAMEEAEEANHAKSTFLATMSHEIRTPLYGVVGTVDMLSHTKLDSSQMDLINTAKDSAILLQGIIDDILDFSKIEAGRLELEKLPLSLESLVEKLGEGLQHVAAKREVELLIYIDPRIPEVKGDSVRLRQILYNLAGNAIKFSGELSQRKGRVVVSALLEELTESVVHICLRISDNGIGMNAEVQKRLFMPFVQGEEETTRRFGGTGLGLVITQRLVEMMDGYINIESVEGQGSTFSVHISLEQATEAQQEYDSDLQGLKVVLVHSSDDVAWIMTDYLQHAGAEVLPVGPDEVNSTCREACHGIKGPIVVIDTAGDRNAAQPLREEMRKSTNDVDLRFVLVERGRRRFARPKDDDGMTLDLNAMRRVTLLNAVAAVAGRESPIQDIEAPKEILSEAPISIDEARKTGRLILLADDNETNRKLIRQQLQMLGYLAEAARDGVEALEMWHNGGYAMLMTDCHMPELDGYQLSATIRREEAGEERKPIIAITADALKGAAQKCFDAGMDDYLAKPIQLHQLREMLEKWLPDTAQENVVPEKQDIRQKASAEIIDPLALGQLLGTQDSEMLAEYYNDFLETSTPTAEEIRNAFDNNDLPLLGDRAHKLKSAARTIGANSLADCCLALELAGKEGDAQTVSTQIPLFFRLFEQVRNWIEQYNRDQ